MDWVVLCRVVLTWLGFVCVVSRYVELSCMRCVVLN